MGALNIGALSRQDGIQPSAICYYEDRGLMPPPRVGGWRRYDATMVDQRQVIQTARELGFSIEDIRTLLNGFPQAAAPCERWHCLAEQKLSEIANIDTQATALKDLLEAGLNCTCDDIALCLNTKGESCRGNQESGVGSSLT